MKTKQYFQAHNGIGFKDIQKFVANNGYNIRRTPYNNRKFVIYNDNEQYLFNWAAHLHLLHKEMLNLGIEEFIKKYKIEINKKPISYIAASQSKTLKKIREEKRHIKQNEKLINQINNEITNTTLEIMHYKTIRGSEKHLQLRQRLYELHKKRLELGYKNNCGLSSEIIKTAKKRGEEKRKQRRTKMNKKGENYEI